MFIYLIRGLTIGVTMGESRARAHLELAAIVTAFVAVTALFSFVSLAANAMEGGPAPGPGAYPVLPADDPHLAPVGAITGSSSVPESSGTSIDTITFRVVHTGGGNGPVDLARTTVTVMAGTYLEILTQSGAASPGPGTWTATPPRGDTLLLAGEDCEIRLCLDRPVSAGEALTVWVRPEGGGPCSITGSVNTSSFRS